MPALVLLTLQPCRAQTTLVREGAEVLLKAVARYFGKASAKELGQELAQYGGKQAARKLASRLVREGGEEGLQRASALAAQYGPDVLRALDHAPSTRTLLRALDDLPPQDVAPALRRLSAGSQGRRLATVVERHGAGALRAELAHPGLGGQLVRLLGDDGIKLAASLNRNQVITLTQQADDIGKLAAAQKTGLMQLFYDDTKGMIAFIGRFMEQHPGKVLFTAVATTVILSNADRILGGADIVLDADGNPTVASKPGLIDRLVDRVVEGVLHPLLRVLLPIIALGAALWIAIKLWPIYQHQRATWSAAVHQRHADNVDDQHEPSRPANT
jgi:hypothetical protein